MVKRTEKMLSHKIIVFGPSQLHLSLCGVSFVSTIIALCLNFPKQTSFIGHSAIGTQQECFQTPPISGFGP